MIFCACVSFTHAQDSLNLRLHPQLILAPSFNPANIHVDDYRLGDDVFMVEYEPIIRTSFDYSNEDLPAQIARVEAQGGIFWMDNGTALLIRNSRISEFRLGDTLIARHFKWRTLEDVQAALGKPSEIREDRFLESGPPDYIDYFYDAKQLRIRYSPRQKRLIELVAGTTSEDSIWE